MTSERIQASNIVQTGLSVTERLDVPLTPKDEQHSSLLKAALALLEAREDQMLTHVEWDRLKDAVALAIN